MKRLSILFILILGSVFWVLPSATQAESCSCFCESSEGATDQGEVADVASCQDVCDDYLGCYTEEQSSLEPRFNTLCWEDFECITSELEHTPGVWAGQHRSCINGEGYCYSEPIPVSLNVAIGSLTEAESLGEYINAGYSYLLGAGSLLAIVMIMLGGIQYMLARGKPEAIGKAKTRIKGAVTGIILLFASYAIANFVDPSFTTFNRVAPPKIKASFFLDPDSTCEARKAAGITITPSEGVCGDVGIVSNLGDISSAIEEGDECVFSACSDPAAKCNGNIQEESGYRCERCYQLADTAIAFTGGDWAIADSETLNISLIAPSSSACSRMTPVDLYPEDDLQYYCMLNNDYHEECVEISYPEGEIGVDCERLRQDAEAADSESCRAYDLLTVGSFDIELSGDGLDYYHIDEYTGEDDEYTMLEYFCEQDICNLAPPNDSCSVVVEDVDSLSLVDFGLGSDIASYLMGDVIVNCANSAAIEDLGLANCIDKNGDPTECNPTW